MDPAIFRKGDASSVLVVDKSWNDIIDKPDFFDELAERIVLMTDRAESIGMMLKSSPLKDLKNAINLVLMDSLIEDVGHGAPDVKRKEGSVLVDALWDEIQISDADWKRLYTAIEKAVAMKDRTTENYPFTSSDTLMSTKDKFNDTVLKPLLGINEDE